MSLSQHRSGRSRWLVLGVGLALGATVTVGCASSDPVLEAGDDTVVTTTVAPEAPPTDAPSGTDDTGSGTGEPTGTDAGAPGATGDPDPATPDTVAGDPPLAPTGLFINTHELSLTGTGAPRDGHSVCQTSPGATCEIRFLSGDRVVGSLEAEPVGDSGVVSWDWTPDGIGLTPGNHRVEVVAIRGGHEVTVTDARDLVVVD